MEDSPNHFSISLLTAIGVLTLLLIIAGGLLFPAVSGPSRNPSRAVARANASQLTSALKAYYTEYGRWPDVTDDGQFLDEARNARLMRILRAPDEVKNPQKIVFFEAPTATKSKGSKGRFGGGLHPETSALLDPWGNPYRILLDADYDDQIASPYPDDASPVIRVGVLVWSLGKDGVQGAPANPRTSRGSDDILSWQ